MTMAHNRRHFACFISRALLQVFRHLIDETVKDNHDSECGPKVADVECESKRDVATPAYVAAVFVEFSAPAPYEY